MKNQWLLFLTLCLFTLLFTACSDNDPVEPGPISSIEQLNAALEDVLDETDVPGFALSIAKDGALIYQNAFGYATLESGKPYTNQTVQNIASTSKSFVAISVVKAMNLGYFTMETPINEVLPFEVHNPKVPNGIIRVKHLVTHTSGLLDNQDLYVANNYFILPGEATDTEGAQIMIDGLDIDQRDGYDMDEWLAEYFIEGGQLYALDNFANTEPGSTWSYSNLATSLVAIMIENQSGKPFYQFVKDEVLNPLQMTQSTFNYNAVNSNALATAYLPDEVPLPFYANDCYAEGGMYTSNNDMGKYLLEMLNGLNGGGSLLEAAEFDLMFSNQLEPGIVPADFASNHGIFWIKDASTIAHGGNSLGISTELKLQADGTYGYSLLTNMDASFEYAAYADVRARMEQAIEQFVAAN